jgi:hypothetical protein
MAVTLLQYTTKAEITLSTSATSFFASATILLKAGEN